MNVTGVAAQQIHNSDQKNHHRFSGKQTGGIYLGIERQRAALARHEGRSMIIASSPLFLLTYNQPYAGDAAGCPFHCIIGGGESFEGHAELRHRLKPLLPIESSFLLVEPPFIVFFSISPFGRFKQGRSTNRIPNTIFSCLKSKSPSTVSSAVNDVVRM